MKKVNFDFTKVRDFFNNLTGKIRPDVESTSSAQSTIRRHQETLNWDKLRTKSQFLLLPEGRKFIHHLFISVLVLQSAYYAGKTTSFFLQKFLTPSKTTNFINHTILPSPPKLSRNAINIIKEKNLFHASLKDKEYKNLLKKPILNLAKDCKQADRPSKLGIKLVNTTVLQDSVKSIASVQVRGSNKLLDIREGDKIKSMAKVSKIERLYVILKNLKTGQCEYIKRKSNELNKKIEILNPSLGKKVMSSLADQGIKNIGNHFSIKNSVRNEMLNNISKVLTQAKAIPIRGADGNLNFKITDIVPGSIYSKLNLQNDDIITRINGKPIQSMNEVMSMFGSFRTIDHLSLSIKREGEEQNFDYQFE